jgi:hypothetical protein
MLAPKASRRKLRSACETSDLDATLFYHMKRPPPAIFPLHQRELEDQGPDGPHSQITWDSSAFDSLVLPEARKETIQSLAERHTNSSNGSNGKNGKAVLQITEARRGDLLTSRAEALDIHESGLSGF